MANYKKHHYVPQFYLRYFSDDSKSVNAYNLKNEKLFLSKIRNVCQENYFYVDVELEKILGQIEEKQAKILQKLLIDFSFHSLNYKEKFYLYLFILMQFSRTKGSAKLTDEAVDLFYHDVMTPILKSSSEMEEKGFTSDFIDKTTLKMDHSHFLPMSAAMMSVELIADLDPIILINETEDFFITSDHFISLYNYVKFKNYGTLGLQSPGLQIYCPLNERIVFLLIDSEFYHIKLDEERNGTGIIYIDKSSDIAAINKLQILNCEQNIICPLNTKEAYMQKIYSEVKPLFRDKKLRSRTISDFKAADGSNNEILHTFKIPSNYKLHLSFLRLNHELNRKWKSMVKKTVKDDDLPKFCRSPKACEIVKKRIDEKIGQEIKAKNK